MATVSGVPRVRYDLMTKPPPPFLVAGFPGSSVGKESACKAGDWGSIPGSGRPPGEGHGTPLQYSFLGNPTDRGAWWATVQGYMSRAGHG